MKKKLLVLLILLAIVIGGYFLINQNEKNQLVKEVQEKAEQYIFSNYQDIRSVHINKDQHHFDPMGGLSVGGYVNDDVDMDFLIIYITEDEKIVRFSSIAHSENFPPEKEECENKICE